MSGPRLRSVDAPERDANVKALDGFDVTAMTVAEMREAGIRLRGISGEDRRALGRTWRSHSEYAGMDPERDALERGYARLAALNYVGRTGKLEGLRLARSFPCLGMFRVREQASRKNGKGETVYGRATVMVCDACGEELGVVGAASGTAWTHDDIPI